MLSDRDAGGIDHQVIDAALGTTRKCSKTSRNYVHGSITLNLKSERLLASVYVLNRLQDHQSMRFEMGQQINYQRKRYARVGSIHF